MSILLPEPFDIMPIGAGIPGGWTSSFGTGTCFAADTDPGGPFPVPHNWYAYGGGALQSSIAGHRDKITIYFAFRKRFDILGEMMSIQGLSVLPPPNDKLTMIRLVMEQDQSISIFTGGLAGIRFGNTGFPLTGADATFFNAGVWFCCQLNLEIIAHDPADPIPIKLDFLVDGIPLIATIESGTLTDALFGIPAFDFLTLQGSGNTQLPHDWSQVQVEDIQDLGTYIYGQRLLGINIINAGIGYSNPTVVITSSTGGGASAHATTNPDGSLLGVVVDSMGRGYKTPIVITVTDPTGAGAILEAVVAQPNKRVSQMIAEVAKMRETDERNIRISQQAIELAKIPRSLTRNIRISQMVIELATLSGDTPPPGSGGWKVREA